MPRISVIMPFYNCEKYLDEAISSILNQTFANFELILINDASTDSSDSICKKYLYDSRIVYVKNEANKKIVYNLNLGLSMAKASIIARMDGDDISDATRLEKQYNFLLKNKEIVLIGTWATRIDGDGNETGMVKKLFGPANIKKTAFFMGPHIHPSIMFRKNIIVGLGGYRQEYLFCEDIDLYFRVIYSGLKTDNLPEFLLKYRVHSNSSDAKDHGRKAFLLKKEIIKKFNLKLTPIEVCSMYGDYALAYIFTSRQKHRLESLIKRLFVNV